MEPVSLFDDDSLSAPIITDNAEQVVDTKSEGYVKLVAQPPQHINIVSADARLPLATVDKEGFFKAGAEYSNKYLAGYEQIDFPEQGAPGSPEFLDPDDYHQDRPSFQVCIVDTDS